MVVPGVVMVLAATACGLWAVLLVARGNPGAPVPVLTGRGVVDPARARGLRAAMAVLTIIGVGVVAREIGWAAMSWAAPPLLLPLLVALGYNAWLRWAGRRTA